MANVEVVGKRYNMLLAIAMLDERSPDNHLRAIFRCDCGIEKPLAVSRVVKGYVKSCGCLALQTRPNLRHGMKGTKEYSTWSSIINRCHCSTSKDYPKYGAVGIAVYPQWRDDFVNFLNDVGLAPTKEHQIDRIDTKGNYEPGNVKWSTRSEQQRNRTTAFYWNVKGKAFGSAQEAADYFKVSEQTIIKWVRGYFDKRRGTFTPARKECYAIPRY